MQYERIPGGAEDEFDHVLFATRASWAVNWLLFFVKLYVVVISNSKAVAAALVDSAVDLVCQAVLSTAEVSVKTRSENYPIGRSRLEALGVLSCAAVMIMASIEVVQYSVLELYNGHFRGVITQINSDWIMMAIMGMGTVLKFLLYIYCTYANQRLSMPMDSMDALAEDHLNDVMSNSVAIVTAAIAVKYKNMWWIDPVGAILISAIIIYRWYDVILDQVKKIVGHTAPPEFIESMNRLAESHDHRIEVDITRAYHYGAAFNVEMEICLPEDMTVRESHDIALALQHRIEEFDTVERAFVHVDYMKRDGLEHKVERHLYHKSTSGEYAASSASSSPTKGLTAGGIESCTGGGRVCLNPDHIPDGSYGSV